MSTAQIITKDEQAGELEQMLVEVLFPMIITKAALKKHQLAHYEDRLNNARSTEEKSFLRGELYRLKQSPKVFDNDSSSIGCCSHDPILALPATLG